MLNKALPLALLAVLVLVAARQVLSPGSETRTEVFPSSTVPEEENTIPGTSGVELPDVTTIVDFDSRVTVSPNAPRTQPGSTSTSSSTTSSTSTSRPSSSTSSTSSSTTSTLPSTSLTITLPTITITVPTSEITIQPPPPTTPRPTATQPTEPDGGGDGNGGD